MTALSDEAKQLTELLRQRAVWEAAPAPPAGIAALAALEQRLKREEAAARELIGSLAATPPAWWRTAIAKSPARQSVGVVRRLLEAMREVVNKTPAHALELTSLAVDVANDILLTDYPSDLVISLRADAWRDHAYVLQYLGRFPEALAAIDTAEHLQRQTAVPEYGLARINLVRANILTWTEKRSEAIALARAAAETFLQFGDGAKYVTARMTEASTLYEVGAIREALAIWDSIKNEESLPELTRVMLMSNIGVAYRELGNVAKAIEHLTVAIAEYELLGMDDSAARSRWALATTLVSAGKFKAAIPLLEKVWKEFERLQSEADAALVALELAETLLVIGEPERVPHICRALLDRFTRAGMTSRAITALSFLREVVALGKAQPSVVRQVREFLRDLPSQGRPMLSLPLREPER